MNIVIKSEARLESESRVLKEYGHNPKTASPEAREHAETVAARLSDVDKIMRKEGKI